MDFDAACKVAFAKAAGWLKNHPNQQGHAPVGNASRFAAPVWYVMWGTSKNGYATMVSATTGAIVK